jgi:hypothetical protein
MQSTRRIGRSPTTAARQTQFRISELPRFSFRNGRLATKSWSPRWRAAVIDRSNSSSTSKWLSPPDASTPNPARAEALQRRADRLAQGKAARRARLVRRIAGVQQHRHHRDRPRLVRQPLADKGGGMPLAIARRQAGRRGDVDIGLHEPLDQVQGEALVHRIVARFLALDIRRAKAGKPFRHALVGGAAVGDRLAP